MLTNGEFASRIVNDLNALNKDAHISRRWLLSIGRTKAESYVAQRWDDGSLLSDRNLITDIKCVEMIYLPIIECCNIDIPRCEMVMRSKHRIPGLIFSNLGPAILTVSNIDNTFFYKYADIKTIRNQAKRVYGNKNKFYFISDRYLYIVNDFIISVNISLFTTKKREASLLSNNCNYDDRCKSEWEFPFVCPIKLIEYIAAETVKEAITKIQVPTDENPNMDLNIKSKTVE